MGADAVFLGDHSDSAGGRAARSNRLTLHQTDASGGFGQAVPALVR